MLADAGLKTIEAGAFVAAPWIPQVHKILHSIYSFSFVFSQMADSHEVLTKLANYKNVNYPVLVPNLKGLQRAMNAGANEIAIFGAASQTFSMKNINCTIEKALERFVDVSKIAKERNIRVRGYTIFKFHSNPNSIFAFLTYLSLLSISI